MLYCSAYLYSWLKSGILLSCYDAEHLVHGAVGFLLDVYVEHILGVEEGRCDRPNAVLPSPCYD